VKFPTAARGVNKWKTPKDRTGDRYPRKMPRWFRYKHMASPPYLLHAPSP